LDLESGTCSQYGIDIKKYTSILARQKVFVISYLVRPWRLISTIFHLLRGVESTKVECIGHAKLSDTRKLLSIVLKKRRHIKAKDVTAV